MRNLKTSPRLKPLLFLCACLAPALAGAGAKPADPPVSIVVPAQLLAAEIHLESDGQSWESRLVRIGEARRFIQEAAAGGGLTAGIVQPLIGHHPRYGGGGDNPDVVLSCPVGAKSDLVKVIQQVEGIIARLSVENKVSASIGRIYLSVDDPESYRGELLRQIRAYVESTAKALSDSPQYAITGLEQPVQVRQRGERDVELFIPFSVTYGQPKTG